MLNLSQFTIKLSQTVQNNGEKHQKSNIQCNTPTQSFDNILSLFNMMLAPVTNAAKSEAPLLTQNEKAEIEITNASEIKLTESNLLEFDSLMMEWFGYYQQLQPITNQNVESSNVQPSTSGPQPVVMSSVGHAMKDVQNELTQWFHSIGGIEGLSDSERNQFIEHVTRLVYEMNGLNERQSNATIVPVPIHEKAKTVHEENQSSIGNTSFLPAQQEDIVEKIKAIFGLSKDDGRSMEAGNASNISHNKVVFDQKMEGIRPPLIQAVDSDKRTVTSPINGDDQSLKEYVDPLKGIVRSQNVNDWHSTRITNKLSTNREGIAIQNSVESLNEDENTLLMNKSQGNRRIVDVAQTAEGQGHQETSELLQKEEMKSQATVQSKANQNIIEIPKSITAKDEQIPIKLSTIDEVPSPITNKASTDRASIEVSKEMVGKTNVQAPNNIPIKEQVSSPIITHTVDKKRTMDVQTEMSGKTNHIPNESVPVPEGEVVSQSENILQHNNRVNEVPTLAEGKPIQKPLEASTNEGGTRFIHNVQPNNKTVQPASVTEAKVNQTSALETAIDEGRTELINKVQPEKSITEISKSTGASIGHESISHQAEETSLRMNPEWQTDKRIINAPSDGGINVYRTLGQSPAEVVVTQPLIHPYQSDKRKIDAQKDMRYILNPNDATVSLSDKDTSPFIRETKQEESMLFEAISKGSFDKSNRIQLSTQLKSTNSSNETTITNPINETKGQAPNNPDNVMKPNHNPASVDILDDSQPLDSMLMGNGIHKVQTAKTDFSPSAAASKSVLSLNDFVPEINEWMGRFFKITNGASGSSEAKFKLNPEHLGQLEIKIISQQGQISAQIVTDTALAKEALDAQLSLLKQALQQQGLQVQKLEIVQQAPNSPDFNQGNQPFSQGGNTQQFNQSNEQGSYPSAENGSSHQKEDIADSGQVEIEKEMPSFTYGGASARTTSRINFTA